MILTVTPNPMLDKTLYVSKLTPGATHRAQRVITIGSGKGINVARALWHLGAETLATGFLGGHTGQQVRKLLDGERLPNDFIEITASTRIGFTVFDEASNQYTAVFEPGPELQAEEIKRLVEKIELLLPRCQALALGGSMPGTSFADLYFRLIHIARQRNVPVFLDSYQEPLRLGLAAQPNFLKPNRDEALQTFGVDSREPHGMRTVLQQLAQAGVQWIFLTDGERPVGVYAAGQYFLVTPPRINLVNGLGSGDAMVGAFLYGWLRKMTAEDLIRFTVAAGAVNAEEFMPGFADLPRMQNLAKSVKIMTPF